MIINKTKLKYIAVVMTAVFMILSIFGLSSCTATHIHCYDDWEVVTPATCEEEGVKIRTCSICGETEEAPIPKAEHKFVVDEGYPATCHTTGLTAGAHCEVCGEVLIEQEVIPMLAHVPVSEEEEDPLLAAVGLTRCAVCGDIIVKPETVDELEQHAYAYKAVFGTDGHVAIKIYYTQNYTDPVSTNIAYSRDGSSGALLKNGEGQINFELEIESGYYLKDIYVSPGYKNLKTPEETGRDNSYRITKITDDLVIFVSTQEQVQLLDFASDTSDDGDITFSWTRDSRIDHVNIDVSVDGESVSYAVEGGTSWKLQDMRQGALYSFNFTPYEADGTVGIDTSCTRYYDPDLKSIAFPRLEITTQDHIWPSCDYVAHPVGCVGSSITNNNYEQCVLDLYDENNNVVYSSSGDDDYSQAKIKVRGNTSAYTEKKPYKIKLSKKADLLSAFVPNRLDNYAHKEWLLLKSGENVNTVIGCSVSETLQMDYTPSYAYCTVFVNGDYRGIYILCESVSQGNGTGDDQTRCAIDDDGFIVECDAYWWNEDLYFTTPLNHYSQRYTFKYPDPDDIDATSAEYDYIYSYISDFERALISDGESYADYIDVPSFAKWLICHDVLGSGDGAGANIYVTKKDSSDSSVLKMGPVWDFDSITLCNEKYSTIHSLSKFYYPLLLGKSSFATEYEDQFASYKDGIIDNIASKVELINAQSYNAFIDVENERWGGESTCLHIEQYVENMLSKIESQIAWLEDQLLN